MFALRCREQGVKVTETVVSRNVVLKFSGPAPSVSIGHLQWCDLIGVPPVTSATIELVHAATHALCYRRHLGHDNSLYQIRLLELGKLFLLAAFMLH